MLKYESLCGKLYRNLSACILATEFVILVCVICFGKVGNI